MNVDIHNLQILAQLIEAMSEASKKLEYYYENRDIENFNLSKKAVLDFQKKIEEMLK